MENRNPIAALPQELQFNIFQHLSLDDAVRYRESCIANRDAIDSYYPPVFYYAVGAQLKVYESSFLGAFLAKYAPEDILDSLSEGRLITLFNNPAAAKKFLAASSSSHYIRSMDIYEVYKEPALFVVQLKHGYKIREMNHDFFAPAKNVGGLWTTSDNIKNICIAQFNMQSKNRISFFNGALFHVASDSGFKKIWNTALLGRDHQNDAHLAVRALFESYSQPFYAFFSRHHFAQVDEILQALQARPALDDLLHLLQEKQKNFVHLNPKINLQGHFARMVDFAIGNVEQLHDLLKLPGFTLAYK